ncbi:GATA zinc finger domain-containing protein 14-like isoform X2 [Vanessa cardui]|uniref:GATA zinc finger domain-containing protein 14-like isoform X2 n=1 Tax=Vanessa cardui TaxID=171605 RepID=UPI001F12BA70|nr:GATA zinc finger domain-containing protein 14-like isoform X2 [Vanessa cardui]
MLFKMRLLIMICAIWALAYGKPEMYKEKEDFQFSRSSSDDGSKSGYYGAQRGNMGGNYEKAHNMDSLAQHQMSTLVRQVDGELGEGANTRTGSVFTSGNSRGLYGSGNYDLTNLHGRNFEEGVSYGDSRSQSSLSSQNSAYTGSSYSAANNARYSANQLRAAGLSSTYRQAGLASQYGQFDNQQAESQYSGASNYERGSQAASNYKYYSHGGSQARSEYDQSSTNLNSFSNSDDISKSRLITTPVRVYVRPGTRIAIPIAAQTYDASQTSLVHDLNAVNTEADVLSNGGQRVSVMKPKHYESSYSYRKEWEKHDTQPVTVLPTENPFPVNSELYEDTQLSQAAGQRYQSALDSSNVQSSGSNSAYARNVNSGYTSGYSANTKSAAASRLQYQAQHQSSGASANSNLYALDTANSDAAANLNNLVDTTNSRPKSYHSSYSYHKSWERRGDPYVIKPVGGDLSGQASQRLIATAADQNLYSSSLYGNQYGQAKTSCDELCHLRKRRSYNIDWENVDTTGQQTQNKWDDFENMGQQTQTQWGNLEDLGQQTQNKWDDLESLSQHPQSGFQELNQQPQKQLGDLEDLGQQTQNTWDNLESLNQHPQSGFEVLSQQPLNQLGNLEDLGQQTQSNWDNLDSLNQHPQSGFEELSQQPQNQLGNLEDLGQQTQNKWDNLESLNQHPQSGFEELSQQPQNQLGNLEDLGQQTQNKWDNLESLNQHPQSGFEELGQQTQSQLDHFKDLGQQTQNTWDNLEKLNQQSQNGLEGQQTQSQWHNLESLGQEKQNQWNNFENSGQQTQNLWDKFEQLTPQKQDKSNDQQTINTWNRIEDQQSRNFEEHSQTFEQWAHQNTNSGDLDQSMYLNSMQPIWNKINSLEAQKNIESSMVNHQQVNFNQESNWKESRDNFNQFVTRPQDHPMTTAELSLWDTIDKLIKESEKNKDNIDNNQYLHTNTSNFNWVDTQSTNNNYHNTNYEHDFIQSIEKTSEKSVQPTEPNKNIEIDSKDTMTNKTEINKNDASPKNNITTHQIIPIVDIGRGDIGPDDTPVVSIETSGQSNDDKVADSISTINSNKLYKTQQEIESLSLKQSNENQFGDKLDQEPIILSVIGLDHQFEVTSTSTVKPRVNYYNSYNDNNHLIHKEYNRPSYIRPSIAQIEPKYDNVQISEAQIPEDIEQQHFAQTFVDMEQQMSNADNVLIDFGQQQQAQVPFSENMQQELYAPQEIGSFNDDLQSKNEQVQTEFSQDKKIKESLNENERRFQTASNLESVPKNKDMLVEQIEPTEKPGFWKSVWSKTKSAKESVVSWFKS